MQATHTQQKGVGVFHCTLDSPFPCYVLGSFQVPNPLHRLCCPANFFTHKNWEFSTQFHGRWQRTGGRVQEKSWNVDCTFLSLTHCAFIAGGGGTRTDTQCSGAPIKHSWAAYCNYNARIAPPIESQGEARGGIAKPGSGVGTEKLREAGGGHHLLEGEWLLSAPFPGPLPAGCAEAGPGILAAADRNPWGRRAVRRRAAPWGRRAVRAAGGPARPLRRGLGEPIAPCAQGGSEDGRTDRATRGRGEPPPAGCTATWSRSNMVAAHASHSSSSGEWISCLDKRYRHLPRSRCGGMLCVCMCMYVRVCLRWHPPSPLSHQILPYIRSVQVGRKTPGESQGGGQWWELEILRAAEGTGSPHRDCCSPPGRYCTWWRRGAPGREEGLGLPAGDTPPYRPWQTRCILPSSALTCPHSAPAAASPPLGTPPPLPQRPHSPRPASSQGGRERTSPSGPRCGAPGPAVVPGLRVRCRRAAAPRGRRARLADVCSELVCALPKIRANYCY